MVNLLNQEIKAIQTSMAQVKRAIPLSVDTGEKLKLQEKYDELEKILIAKLGQCGEFKS